MGQRSDIVAIALKELGYKEGRNNATKFGAWYGMDHNPWCAMFVSWCAAQAGVSQDVILKFAYVPYGVQFFKGLGRWQARSSGYIPQPGDVIFYGGSGSSGAHVGLVEKAEAGYVYAIEGNTSSSGNVSNGEGVYRRKRKLSNSWIMGYGTPDYEEDDMRYTTISELPRWGRDIVTKMVDCGALKGNEKGLDLSEDMLRTWVIWQRYLEAQK